MDQARNRIGQELYNRAVSAGILQPEPPADCPAALHLADWLAGLTSLSALPAKPPEITLQPTSDPLRFVVVKKGLVVFSGGEAEAEARAKFLTQADAAARTREDTRLTTPFPKGALR